MNPPRQRTCLGRRACLALALWGPIALLLAGSYVFLAVRHGRVNLFPVVVHENGTYTLTQTIFYFRHFLREILPTAMIAAGAVGAFQFHAPARALEPDHRSELRRVARWLGWGAIGFLAVTVGIAISQEGAREALVDLLQYRTRDDRSEYGTQWQYHFLHLLDAIGFSVALAYLTRGLSGQGEANSPRRGIKMLTVWFVAFAGLTLIFVPSLRPFNDPLYLAHQFREIATSRVLLLPAIFGLLLLLERKVLRATEWPPIHPRRLRQGVIWLVLVTGIPLWIYWRLRHADVLSLAQRRTSLAELYAAHNFEHCLDVLFALLGSGWLYLRLALRESGNNLPAASRKPA